MIPLILLAVLQCADYWTTTRILAAGGREHNSLLVRWFAKFGMKRTLIVKGIAVVGVGYFIGEPLIWLVIAAYVAVIGFNLRSIK